MQTWLHYEKISQMKETNTKPAQRVICFGEILWDNLPGGRKPGGAPMNVAYHLNKLGIESTLISRVGNDSNGDELLQFIESKGLSVKYCQRDRNFPTSTVEVNIGLDQEVKYDIVKEADAFVFGRLAARSTVSYTTLHA